MKRADFVFTTGFDGSNAIVDKQARSRFGKLDTRSLADKGLFRAACRSAVYDQDSQAALYVLQKYNAVSSIQYAEPEDLEKMFGVQPPSDDITGIRAV